MELYYCDRCDNKNVDYIYSCNDTHQKYSLTPILHRSVCTYLDILTVCKICRNKLLLSTDCGICLNCPVFNFCDKCTIELQKIYTNKSDYLNDTVSYLISNKLKLNDYFNYILLQSSSCSLYIINNILYHQRYDIYNYLIIHLEIIY